MPQKIIYIIGVGPGAQKLLTGEAREALLNSEHVLGAERLLNSFETLIHGKKKDALSSDKTIAETVRSGASKVYAVIVSGDSGFYSLSKYLFPLLHAEAQNWELKILCGVSSVSYFAARLGLAYDDAMVKSFHGRLRPDSAEIDKERLLNELTGLAACNGKCFFLTDGAISPNLICRTLTKRGLGELRVSIGERLSYPDEKISSYMAKNIVDNDFDTPNVVCIENDKSRKNIRVNMRDSDFIRGSVPMSKEDVRALSLSKLCLKPDAVCWDIGAGTGSLSCSMALTVPYGRVYAVEKDTEALNLIRQNKEKFGCYNIEIIEGAAPSVLSTLPPPDSVFIGGSGGELLAIVNEIYGKNCRARIVINAITLETLNAAQAIIIERQFSDAQITQISVSEFKKTGAYNLLRAQNPVFIISFSGEP
jgi:precorrin-6Y C5,15-methyltransferase (decarboxylating)